MRGMETVEIMRKGALEALEIGGDAAVYLLVHKKMKVSGHNAVGRECDKQLREIILDLGIFVSYGEFGGRIELEIVEECALELDGALLGLENTHVVGRAVVDVVVPTCFEWFAFGHTKFSITYLRSGIVNNKPLGGAESEKAC
jgi:hypothetical protein